MNKLKKELLQKKGPGSVVIAVSSKLLKIKKMNDSIFNLILDHLMSSFSFVSFFNYLFYLYYLFYYVITVMSSHIHILSC